LRAYGAAGVLFGAAAYANVQQAARASTDQWLADARLLMQESSARLPQGRPTLADLAPLAGGAQVAPGDSATTRPTRQSVGGVPSAVVEVRLSSRRWVELRTAPAEAGAPPWLALLPALALIGPLAAWVAVWAERAAAPRARPPQLGRALGAHGGLPAVRVIGRRSRARVAVDVPHRFRRDQLDAVARRCGARGLAREPEHRSDRLDDRLAVGTGRLSDDRVPRRTAGDSTGLPRRRAGGRRRRLATVADE